VTRRQALAVTGASAFASAAAFAGGRPIRFGGPIFLQSADPAELAREHRRLGYSAAYCPKADVRDSAQVRAIENAFREQNVVIAEVGAWVNMLDPDPDKRAKNLAYVQERLALADAVGARCCVDIAGSYNPTVWYGPHPKNLSPEFFDATVENCRKVIDAVKPKRTVFSLEIMGWSLPDGPDSYLQLMKAIDRKAFGVHLDICNGINSPERFYRNAEFSRECFRKLGPHIASCHAKDLAWLPEMNIHFLEVIPGTGEIDYAPILEELSRLAVDAPLMMEHLKTAEEYARGAAHIRAVAEKVGVTFA
jgi:sugar phosphate isomerase/epimerase